MTELDERELLTQNEQLRQALNAVRSGGPAPGSRATLYVSAVMGLSLATMLAIVIIFAIRPDQDNTGLITVVLALTGPAIAAFLAASVQQVHLAVNSRLSELLLLTQKASMAEGKLAARDDRSVRIGDTPHRGDPPLAVTVVNDPPQRVVVVDDPRKETP